MQRRCCVRNLVRSRTDWVIEWQANIQEATAARWRRDDTLPFDNDKDRARMTNICFRHLANNSSISTTSSENLANTDGSVPSLSDQRYAQWWEMMASQKWCIGQRAHHATRHGLIIKPASSIPQSSIALTPCNLRDSGSVFLSSFLPSLSCVSLTYLPFFFSTFGRSRKSRG